MTASPVEGGKTSPCNKLPVAMSPEASVKEAQVPFAEVRSDAAKATSPGNTSHQNGHFCNSRGGILITEQSVSSATSDEHLQQDLTGLPLEIYRRGSARSHDNIERTAEGQSDRLPQRALSICYDVPPMLGAPLSSQPLEPMQGAKPNHLTAETLGATAARSSSSSSSLNSSGTHDLAGSHVKITPQKRPPAPDVRNPSDTSSKKPRLGKGDGFQINKQTKKLIPDEHQGSERARQLPDSGDIKSARAEYEKIRQLSDQRNEIRSQLLRQPCRPLATQHILDHAPTQGDDPQAIPMLPRASPLNNLINSATLQEEIVQAKVMYNLAQEQLAEDKARQGSASEAVLARVTHLNQKLAILHRRRREIMVDGDRMHAFRRRTPPGYEDQGQVPSKTPPISLDDTKWVKRCNPFENALQAIQRGTRDSQTRSGKEMPMIKQETSDQNGSSRVEESSDWDLQIAEPRQVRFALTDVETFL